MRRMLSSRIETDALMQRFFCQCNLNTAPTDISFPSFISSWLSCQIQFIHCTDDSDTGYPTQATRKYRFIDVGGMYAFPSVVSTLIPSLWRGRWKVWFLVMGDFRVSLWLESESYHCKGVSWLFFNVLELCYFVDVCVVLSMVETHQKSGKRHN
jgi:hypothetical protein